MPSSDDQGDFAHVKARRRYIRHTPRGFKRGPSLARRALTRYGAPLLILLIVVLAWANAARVWRYLDA